MNNDCEYLHDINIFNLINLTWYEVLSNGEKLLKRAMHLSGMIDSKLLIFGGSNNKGLIKA